MSAEIRGTRKKVIAVVTLLTLCINGCTSLPEWVQNGFKVGPNYQKPGAPVAEEWSTAKMPGINAATPDLRQWWTVLEEPVLNSLVDTAYRQNLNVRTAGMRVLEARALRNIAVGNLFPQSQQAFLDYMRLQVSRNTANAQGGGAIPGAVGPRFQPAFDNWDVGLNLSWELDFWGRFRRSVEEADARFDASIENYDDVLVLLIAEVAATYVQIRTFQERIKYAEENIKRQSEIDKMAQAQLKGGVGKKGQILVDAPQIRSNLENTKALKAQLEIGLQLANNRLCVLLGIPVRNLLPELGEGKIPSTPPEVIVGVPVELLRRRPDVRQAERLVAAQSARIGIATADLYPRFNLIGSIGYEAENFSQLFESKSFTGNIGPSIRWDILNYGRILNNIRVQNAKFQQEVLNYQNTVLRAGREVEDGMIAFVKTQIQVQHLQESAQNAKKASDVIEARLVKLETSLNQAFVIQNFLVQQQDRLAQVRGEVALSLIQIYRALGGGWQIRLPDSNCAEPKATLLQPVEELPPPSKEILPPPEKDASLGVPGNLTEKGNKDEEFKIISDSAISPAKLGPAHSGKSAFLPKLPDLSAPAASLVPPPLPKNSTENRPKANQGAAVLGTPIPSQPPEENPEVGTLSPTFGVTPVYARIK